MPSPEPPAEGALRVLYVNHANVTGGAEKSLLRLLESLDRDEVTPLLAAPAGDDLAGAAAGLDIPFYPIALNALHRTFNPLSLATQGWMLGRAGRQLARLCRRERVQMVHCNSLVAMLAARPLADEVPLIWHARDLRAPRSAVSSAVQSASLIIAISRAVADFVLRAAPEAEDKLAVVYNGLTRQDVMVGRSREAVRGEWAVPPGAPVVGCVGQIVPWKRHDLFLRAGARLVAQVPDVRLVIVGGELHASGGAYLASLHGLAANLGIADRVVWAGQRSDMADVLSALDVLAHPATEEPLGRVILEALGLGVPVVAADSAGPAEILEHRRSGLLVPPGDADALFQGVRRVLSEPPLAEALRSGAVRRARSFLARDSTDLVVELYRQLIRSQATQAWRWSE
jgi:glycosyltransferase involved in cell wall biosynthesis